MSPPISLLSRSVLLAALTIFALGAAPARAAEVEYEEFLAELEDPGVQFVVISNHFRHSVGCTSRGCVLMGPTNDRAACEEWSKAYNRVDPYDHTRCVESGDYGEKRY